MDWQFDSACLRAGASESELACALNWSAHPTFIPQRSRASNNQFTTLPSDLVTSPNIQELKMEHNNITGVLPDPLPVSLTLLAVRSLFLARLALPD